MFASLASGLARRALFTLDAETAHGLTVKALASGLAPVCPPTADPRLAVHAAGLAFPNPLGMAAGFDKNGEVPDALLRIGFGHTEVGTVTPRPQSGNPKPRVFRLERDKAIVNRLGFNNDGHAALLARLDARAGRDGIVGVNVGANKDAEDRVADYVTGIETFAARASYFTVNISSPNTPGLRDLQARAALAELLGRVVEARERQVERVGRRVPVFLKIAPDMDEAGLDDIAAEVLASGIEGLVVSNTTLSRAGVSDRKGASETGGVSGRPLFRRATITLARMRQRVGPDLPIIGVGGVGSGEAAWTKIAAGATLLQLYTGLVYEGPELLSRITKHLAASLDREGLANLSEATGRNTDAWARLDPDGEGGI
ncbi:MAG: dihydroorotate dehydrogenase (quinone) [Stappia sp.]|uniref:quinone-dependent dihydroorotate dehydrogenase n=1 Tax=Stappia sp. TaxID=1870903 RepID=UPI000C4D90BE|nr:quinone-dependent dihydroorotate dehydrogenase [Stappia sp.]MAA97875.1 dihydroorotate dehydrogenase (quinone) [Stappia sp.]MBM19711.1 dihydroorotate dehydrogenase (quinone) [Stappia sp.]